MKRLLILGAGGHGKVVCETAECMGVFKEIAFLDEDVTKKCILDKQVLGHTERYKELRDTYTYAAVAIGNNKVRMEWIKKLIEMGYQLPVLMHPSAIISHYATIDIGTVVMPQVVVNAGASIGRGCILNTQSVVEHDCKVQDGVHLSPGAVLGGTVVVGRESWIGLGAKVINNIVIPDNTIVGAGAVVVRDIKVQGVYVGVPAKQKG